MKTIVDIIPGEYDLALEKVVAALSKEDANVYVHGGRLVEIVQDEVPNQTLKDRFDAMPSIAREVVTIKSLTEYGLKEVIHRLVIFQKRDKNGCGVACDCPSDFPRMILDMTRERWKMPRLRAVIHAPTFRADGSVFDTAGYDPATGLFLAGSEKWQTVREDRTRDHALAALGHLEKLLAGFPFASPTDKAAAVAMFMTAVIRPSLQTAPMFTVSAPAAGTGKSLLVDIAAILATGRTAPVLGAASDQIELDKRIGAAALCGTQFISIDNFNGILRSDQLCQMLTQEAVHVRELGRSKNVDVPSTAFFCATGNNLTVGGDLARRAVPIRLDAGCERPEQRTFSFNVIDYTKRNRPLLVHAILTIIQAFASAGQPDQGVTLGSFGAWSTNVRSALLWLGYGDCLAQTEDYSEVDPEKAELLEIINALPNGEFTSRDIAEQYQRPSSEKGVFERFLAKTGQFSSRSFGRYLLRYKGVVIGGKRIVCYGYGKLGAIWKVETLP